MDPNDYPNKVCKKFKQDNFKLENDKMDSFDVTIATKSKFKLSWFATRMHFFAIYGFSKNISRETIENYSKSCLNYAVKNKKGLPRGLQTGLTSFALLFSPEVSEEAKKFAQKRPKKHFAAFEMPIIFDLKENKLYYCDENQLWGSIYYKTFKEFINRYFK